MVSKYAPKQYTQQEMDRLVNLYLEDEINAKDFCLIHSIREQTVRGWVRKRGYQNKKLHHVSPKEDLAIYRLMEIGLTYQEIAEQLNLGKQTVKVHLMAIRRRIRETGQIP